MVLKSTKRTLDWMMLVALPNMSSQTAFSAPSRLLISIGCMCDEVHQNSNMCLGCAWLAGWVSFAIILRGDAIFSPKNAWDFSRNWRDTRNWNFESELAVCVFCGEIFILLSICSIVVPLIVPGQVIHGYFFQIDGSRTLAVLETSNTSF